MLHINVLECTAVLRCLHSLGPPQTYQYYWDRQLCCSISNQQARVQQKQDAQYSPAVTPMFMRHSQMVPPCPSYSGPPQLLGGLYVKKLHHKVWMDSECSNIQQIHNKCPSSYWLLRPPEQCQIAQVRLRILPFARNSDGYNDSWLEQVEYNLPVSSNRPDTDLPAELKSYQGIVVFVTPVLPSGTWWPVFIDSCKPINAELDVFQWVHGEMVCARDEMSLTLSRLHFLRKVDSAKFPSAVAESLIESHIKSSR